MITTTSLTEARDIVKNAILRLPSSSQDDTQIDYSIRAAMREFFRRVRPMRKIGTAATVADSEVVDLSALTDLEPSQVIKVEIDLSDTLDPFYSTVQLRDSSNVRSHIEHATSDIDSYLGGVKIASSRGADIIGAFETDGNLLIYPIADTIRTVRIHYYENPTTWTLGVGSPTADNTILNCPDNIIDGLLFYGVPCYYDEKKAGGQTGARSRRLFDKFIRECRSASWSGASVTITDESKL